MILLRSSLNYLKQHYFQSLLAILGIAIGISITVAIDLAIVGSKKSFELSAARVTGEATHQIISNNNQGIDEGIYRKLKVDLALDNAAPRIEAFVVIQTEDKSDYASSIVQESNEKQILKVLGLDPFAEKGFRSLDFSSIGTKTPNGTGGFLSKRTAEKLDLAQGSSFKVRVGSLDKSLNLLGLIEDESSNYDNLLLMDIADAQELLGLEGKLSYIDLKANKEKQFTTAYGSLSLSELENQLGSSVGLQRSAARSESVEQMTESFNLNLTALSFLALIVAVFLIYNSMSFSIVQRRKLIAILKAIGTSQKQILSMIFIEAIIFSVIGVSLGLVLGFFLGEILMGLVTQTINDIYFTLELEKFSLSPATFIKGAVLGIIASLAAAIFPALDASKSSPLVAMSRSSYETRSNINFKKLFITGIFLMLLASLILKLSTGIILSFAALFFILLGFAFATPLIVKIFTEVLKPVYKRLFGFIGTLALKSISSQLSRTSIAIATLMIAISVSMGLNITIKSFRNTVESWLNDSLKADIYISAPRLVSNKADKALEPAFIKSILNEFKDDMEEVLTYKNAEVNTNIGLVNLASINTSKTVRSLMEYQSSIKDSWQRFQNLEDIVLISEPLAYKNKLKPGDSLLIKTPSGEKEFTIGAIFIDFGSDKGIAMMADKVYQKYFEDYSISSLGLLVKPSLRETEVDNIIKRIKARYSNDYTLFIRSNYSLKNESLAVFDRTFKVTNVLKWIAILVAFIAVLSAFMSLQLERVREFAILRANGVSPRQISLLLFLQTITMGLFAAILAIPTGIVQALVMIFVINHRSFGWSLNLSIENNFFLEAFIYSLIASSLAVIYPIYLTNSSKISEALRYE